MDDRHSFVFQDGLGQRRYIINSHDLDLNLLPSLDYRRREEPVPLWTPQSRQQQEYYQVEVYAEERGVSGNDEENENSNTTHCYVCDVDVPACYIKHHNDSSKHAILKTLADISLERVRKQMSQVPPRQVTPSENTYFCEYCSLSIAKSNRNDHESSKKHETYVLNEKMLNSLTKLYKENDIPEEIIKIHAEIKKVCDLMMKNDEQRANYDVKKVDEEEYRKVMKIKAEIPESVDKVVVLKETEDLNPKTSIESYLSIANCLGNHSLQYIDDKYVQIHAISGAIVKVLWQNYHGYGQVFNGTYCLLCKERVIEELIHNRNVDHMQKIMMPIRDKHCLRKVDNLFHHCVLCNEIVLFAETHIKFIQHENNLKLGLIADDQRVSDDETTNEEKEEEEENVIDNEFEEMLLQNDIVQVGNSSKQYYCNFCQVHLQIGTVLEHIKKRHDNNVHTVPKTHFADGNSCESNNDETDMTIENNEVKITTQDKIIVDNYCTVCDVYLPTRDHVKKHKNSLHRYNLWLSREDERIHWHVRIIDENEVYCNVCEITLPKSKEDVLEHIETEQHRQLYDNLLSTNTMRKVSDRKVSCDVCKTQLLVIDELNHRIGKKHKQNLKCLLKTHPEIDILASAVSQKLKEKGNIEETDVPREDNSNMAISYVYNAREPKLFELTDFSNIIRCVVCKTMIQNAKPIISLHLNDEIHKKYCKTFLKNHALLHNLENSQKNKIHHLFELTNVSYKIRCLVCDITIDNTKADIKLHRNDKFHKDQYKNVLEDHSVVKLSEYCYCECCDILIGMEMVMQHINNGQHLNNLSKLDTRLQNHERSAKAKQMVKEFKLQLKGVKLALRFQKNTQVKDEIDEEDENDDEFELKNSIEFKGKDNTDVISRNSILEDREMSSYVTAVEDVSGTDDFEDIQDSPRDLKTKNVPEVDNNYTLNAAFKDTIPDEIASTSVTEKIIVTTESNKDPFNEANEDTRHEETSSSAVGETSVTEESIQDTHGEADEKFKAIEAFVIQNTDNAENTNKAELENESLSSIWHFIENTEEPEQLNCKVCRGEVANETRAIIEHMNGICHETQYQALLLENKVTETNNGYFCEACLADVEKSQLFIHVNDGEHILNFTSMPAKATETEPQKPNLKQKKNPNPELTELESRIMAISHKQYLMRKFSKTELHCKLCYTEFLDDDDTVQKHITTKTHMENYSALITEHEIKKVGLKSFCEVCKVDVLDLAELEHLYGNRHTCNFDLMRAGPSKTSEPNILNAGEENWTCLVCDETVKGTYKDIKIHNSSSSHKQTAQHVPTVKNVIRCNLCRLEIMNTPYFFKFHRNTPMHKQNLLCKDETVQLIGKGNITSANVQKQSLRQTIDEKREDVFKPPAIPLKELNKEATSQSLSTPKSVPKKPEPRKDKSFTCVVCKVDLDNNPNTIKFHYDSKAHKDRAKNFMDNSGDNRPTSSLSNTSSMSTSNVVIAEAIKTIVPKILETEITIINGYCSLCETKVPNNPMNIKDHLNGKPHKSKIAEMTADNTYKCVICNVNVPNVDANIREHLLGAKHKANVDARNTYVNSNAVVGAKTVATESASGTNSNNLVANTPEHSNNTNVAAKNATQTKPPTNIAQPSTSNNKSGLSCTTYTSTMFICHICNVKIDLTNPLNIKAHLNGARHKYNFQMSDKFTEEQSTASRASSISTNSSMASKQTVYTDKLSTQTKLVSNVAQPSTSNKRDTTFITHTYTSTHFKCHVCNIKIALNNPFNIEAHLKGGRHKYNLQMKDKITEDQSTISNASSISTISSVGNKQTDYATDKIASNKALNTADVKKLLSNVTSTSRRYFTCHACDTICINNPTNISGHLASEKHKTNVLNFHKQVAGKATETKQENAKPASVISGENTELLTDYGSYVTCNICDVKVPNSPLNINGHLGGSRHLNKAASMAVKESLNVGKSGAQTNESATTLTEDNYLQIESSNETVTSAQSSNSSKKDSALHVTEENDKISANKDDKANIRFDDDEVPNEDTSEAIPNTENSDTVSDTTIYTGGLYVCEICLIEFPHTKRDMRSHLRSYLHKNNLALKAVESNANEAMDHRDSTDEKKEDIVTVDTLLTDSKANTGKITAEDENSEDANLNKPLSTSDTENNLTVTATVTNTNKSYICDVCNVEVPNTKYNIDGHLGGARHKKNVANKAAETTNAMKTTEQNNVHKKEDSATATVTMKTENKAKDSVTNNGYYMCNVCNVQVTDNKSFLDEHLNGKRHESNLTQSITKSINAEDSGNNEKIAKPNQEIVKSESTPTNTKINTGTVLAVNTSTVEDKSNSEENTNQSINIGERMATSTINIDDKNSIQQALELKDSSGNFVCQICNLTIEGNNPHNIVCHLNGAKHKAKALELKQKNTESDKERETDSDADPTPNLINLGQIESAIHTTSVIISEKSDGETELLKSDVAETVENLDDTDKTQPEINRGQSEFHVKHTETQSNIMNTTNTDITLIDNKTEECSDEKTAQAIANMQINDNVQTESNSDSIKNSASEKKSNIPNVIKSTDHFAQDVSRSDKTQSKSNDSDINPSKPDDSDKTQSTSDHSDKTKTASSVKTQLKPDSDKPQLKPGDSDKTHLKPDDSAKIQPKADQPNKVLTADNSKDANSKENSDSDNETDSTGFYICRICSYAVKNDPVEIQCHLTSYRHQDHVKKEKEKKQTKENQDDIFTCDICHVKTNRNVLIFKEHIENEFHVKMFDLTLLRNRIEVKNNVCYCKPCDLYFNKYSVGIHVARDSHKINIS